MEQVRKMVERSAFGVCSYIGEKMGIATSRVRLFFIYINFVALGSPIIVYLFLAFWLNVRKHLKAARNLVWD